MGRAKTRGARRGVRPTRAPIAVDARRARRRAAREDGMDNVLSIILGGGAGTRLYPLTKKRAKPAVPLGANYRLIDIPVSIASIGHQQGVLLDAV